MHRGIANLPGELKTSVSRLASRALESCFCWPPVDLSGLHRVPTTTSCWIWLSPRCAFWRCQGCFWPHRSNFQRFWPRSWWWWECVCRPSDPRRSPSSGRVVPEIHISPKQEELVPTLSSAKYHWSRGCGFPSTRQAKVSEDPGPLTTCSLSTLGWLVDQVTETNVKT